MKKTVLFGLLIIVLAFGFVGCTREVACPDNYCPESDFRVEQLDDGNLRVVEYLGSNRVVSIPSTINGLPVTRIGVTAFSERGLTSVAIPDSVTVIEGGAFRRNQLASVIMSNNVTSILNWAFANNRLTTITFPDSLTHIGASAFAGNRLTSITIPDNVTSIWDAAFRGNNRLREVSIPRNTRITTSGFGATFDDNVNIIRR